MAHRSNSCIFTVKYSLVSDSTWNYYLGFYILCTCDDWGNTLECWSWLYPIQRESSLQIYPKSVVDTKITLIWILSLVREKGYNFLLLPLSLIRERIKIGLFIFSKNYFATFVVSRYSAINCPTSGAGLWKIDDPKLTIVPTQSIPLDWDFAT